KRPHVIADIQNGHRLANAMPDEPRGFQPALKGALKLAGTDPLFRGGHKVDRLEPYAHRHMAFLENGADLDVEGLAARVALVKADPGGFPPQLTDAIRVHIPAMMAHRAIRPN